MIFKVIVPIGEIPEAGLRSVLLQKYALDFTDILEIALLNWALIELRDDDIIRTSVEKPLDKHLFLKGKRRISYLEFMDAVELLTNSVCCFHTYLSRILIPVISSIIPSGDVSISLSKSLGNSIVLKVMSNKQDGEF